MELAGHSHLDPHALGFRPGNREDFDRLYTITYQRIFHTLLAMLGDPSAAEDCTQDAFLQAFKAWPRWKQKGPPEAWLHRIAINAALAYRRKQRLQEPSELVHRGGLPDQPDPHHVPDPTLLDELRRLPPKQAAALVLRHLHGYSNREIGLALGVSESTIATRLAEAKKTLRSRLEPRSGRST